MRGRSVLRLVSLCLLFDQTCSAHAKDTIYGVGATFPQEIYESWWTTYATQNNEDMGHLRYTAFPALRTFEGSEMN